MAETAVQRKLILTLLVTWWWFQGRGFLGTWRYPRLRGRTFLERDHDRLLEYHLWLATCDLGVLRLKVQLTRQCNTTHHTASFNIIEMLKLQGLPTFDVAFVIGKVREIWTGSANVTKRLTFVIEQLEKLRANKVPSFYWHSVLHPIFSFLSYFSNQCSSRSSLGRSLCITLWKVTSMWQSCKVWHEKNHSLSRYYLALSTYD